jgi:hypothetical protein
MNKTKKHKHRIFIQKNRNKYNHSKRNNNNTRPPKHSYIYKNNNTNTNTNTRKQQNGGIKGTKGWSMGNNRWNLALDTKSGYSSLKNEQAERNDWLKYLISSEWLKNYKRVLSTINEYKNKYKQTWARVLISNETKGQSIVELDEDRQFIKKVGDYFSNTFVKPLRDKNGDINLLLQDKTVLTKMCKQVMFETGSEENTDCKSIIEGLITLNFEILKLEIAETENILENIFLEQDKEFESWIEEDKKQQEEKERIIKEEEKGKKQQSDEMDKLISDELTKVIANQNWQQTFQKFKDFKKRKAKIDYKPENYDLEKDVLKKTGVLQEKFKKFKNYFTNWKSFKNLGNILTKLNLTIEMYTNLIKEDQVFWRDPSLTYYESTKKTYLGNIRVCLEEFNTIIVDIVILHNANTNLENIKESSKNYSKDVKDRLDSDLKYITKQIQLTNLIKDLTFLYNQGAKNEKLLLTYSDDKNYKIYKEIIKNLSLNIVLELYTNYLLNIKNKKNFDSVLDDKIDKIWEDMLQIYSIILDAKEKEKNANVKQEDMNLLKVRQKILEEETKRKISQEEKIGSVPEDEDLTDSAEVEHKEREEDSDTQSFSSTATQGSSIGTQGSSIGTQGSSIGTQGSLESLESLKTIKSELSNTTLLNRSKFTEIKDKLNKISKWLKYGSKGTKSEIKYTNLFSFSEYDDLDEIPNVINSSSVSPPPHQSPTKLTSLTQTIQGLINGLSNLKPESKTESKPESKTESKPESKTVYSETTINPILLKQLNEDMIEKQGIKMKEIARLEHNLRHVNSELGIIKEKYDNNKYKDLFEEELIKQKFIIEGDLNIAIRDLNNLTNRSKTISDRDNKYILGEVKERKKLAEEKKRDAIKSAEKLAEKIAEEIKMEETHKMIEKKEAAIADLVNKIVQNPTNQYDQSKMIEKIDTMIKHVKGEKAKEFLENIKKFITGEKVDITKFKKESSQLGFHESIIKVPLIEAIKKVEPPKPITKSVTPVIKSSVVPTITTTTRLNWQNINDPTSYYLNQITKGTVGNSDPIIKYNQGIIQSKREKIAEETRLKAEKEEREMLNSKKVKEGLRVEDDKLRALNAVKKKNKNKDIRSSSIK